MKIERMLETHLTDVRAILPRRVTLIRFDSGDSPEVLCEKISHIPVAPIQAGIIDQLRSSELLA